MPALASIRVRLTLWYVVLLAIILAAFVGGVYFGLRQMLFSNLDTSIEEQADIILGTLQFDDGLIALNENAASGSLRDTERYTRIFDASGNLIHDTSENLEPIPIDQQAVNRALQGSVTTRSFEIGDDSLRAKTFPVANDGRNVGVLEIGRSDEDVQDMLSSLLLIMGIAYPATLALAILGGLFLAGRALSPVDAITRLARRISADQMGQRLNLDLPDDEVGKLARTFDEMIERLDDAFRRQRQFTSDASHELRTPLTVIKGQIEVALQRERGIEDYREVLSTVNDEVDRLIRLTGSLLTLTRAGTGRVILEIENIALAPLVEGIVEQLRPSAEQKGVSLNIVAGDDPTINADEDLIIQLMLNLIDNAIKYTPSGGSVEVRWSIENSQLVLRVTDTGIGIPTEHIPRIFDRFYRVDRARSREQGGAGLGLAISRWIAEAHNGSITVESAPGQGSTFSLRLNLA